MEPFHHVALFILENSRIPEDMEPTIPKALRNCPRLKFRIFPAAAAARKGRWPKSGGIPC